MLVGAVTHTAGCLMGIRQFPIRQAVSRNRLDWRKVSGIVGPALEDTIIRRTALLLPL